MNIFTIGYEGLDMEEFLDRLRRAHVRMLVDVREAPVSHKRGFSKTPLAEGLRAMDIDYRHMRSLGCPKPIRVRYREDRNWQRYAKAYMQHLHNQDAALRDLARVCGEHTAALLCFEADPGLCHRTYVARAMADLAADTEVWHISASGLVPDSAINQTA